MREQIKAPLRRVARVAKIPAALATAMLLSGCDLTVLDPSGYIAMQQRDLILIATGLMLLIIVPVIMLVVVFAVRYRAGGNATYDPKFDHSMPLELVIWACPLLIIICLGAVTWTSTHLLDPFRPLDRISADEPVPAGTKPLAVQVVALDWKWLFIYPQQGIATVNELALPVNVPVQFSITSSDQMNTFYAPTLAGMIYAMPGMNSLMHAVLNRTGESEGLSANYTGAGFSWMRFKLHGLDQAGFDRWVQGVKAAGAEQKGALTPAVYLELDKPSEKVPVMHFATVTPGLYDRAVNRCVEPGRPCEAAVMAHDAQQNGAEAGKVSVPSSHDSAPTHDSKPVPALMKAPEDKGSGPNVTAPVRPSTPGQPATNN